MTGERGTVAVCLKGIHIDAKFHRMFNLSGPLRKLSCPLRLGKPVAEVFSAGRSERSHPAPVLELRGVLHGPQYPFRGTLN